MSEVLVQCKDLSFTYDGQKNKTLKDLNLELEEGQLIFLTGASGSGKSTFLNLLTGVIPEIIEGNLTGQLSILGQEHLPIHERSRHFSTVFQNPRSQFFTNHVISELVFEMENMAFSQEEMQERLDWLDQSFPIATLSGRTIDCLSSGERQLLALMTALIMQPRLLIFDEPSANLDYGNAMRLRRQLQALKGEGKTILVADHRCFYLKDLIDQVILLDDNRAQVFDSQRAFDKHHTGYGLLNLFDLGDDHRPICRSKDKLFEIQRLSYQSVLEDISLSFYKGEVTTIVGVNGVGKTCLAKLIAKLVTADKGELNLDEQALYLMQDADFQLFGSSCFKELEMTCSDRDKIVSVLKSLRIEHLAHKHPHSLSGGEKQRLQMAIAMLSPSQVIIMDEPTSGLDHQSMLAVAELITRLRKDKCLILISHDYEFIRKTSDRIIYLKDKGVADDFYLEKNAISKLNKIYHEMEAFYETKLEN